MNYLKRVQMGIDYIEDNLDFDVSLAEVAQATGLSQWHFQRIFKALTHETLKTYIRSRRMANALDKLLSTNFRILDIAISAGFESQESFTRAFQKTFGISPSAYRKLGNKSLFLKKAEFNADYLKHINQNISLEPEIYTQPSMQLVGLRTQFYSVDSEKNNIADKLPALWAEFLERIGEIKHTTSSTCYGVVKQTDKNSDLLEYYAVIQVSDISSIPSGMESIKIESSIYAKFTHQGDMKNLNDTINYIYSSWLLKSGQQHTSAPDLEVYKPDEYEPCSASSKMYYAIPIK